MQLTKYAHACFTVEMDGQTLVIDPGEWSVDFELPKSVAGIIITHEHADHCFPAMLRAIVDANPDTVILAHADITSQLDGLPTRAVSPGEHVTLGEFELEFFGGKHATIHASMPIVTNLGIMINNAVYYPGDSFVAPGRAINTLLLPVSAPWLKVSEVLDFVSQTRPSRIIPTHDAILSDTGKALLDRIVGNHGASTDASYQRLDGQSIMLE